MNWSWCYHRLVVAIENICTLRFSGQKRHKFCVLLPLFHYSSMHETEVTSRFSSQFWKTERQNHRKYSMKLLYFHFVNSHRVLFNEFLFPFSEKYSMTVDKMEIKKVSSSIFYEFFFWFCKLDWKIDFSSVSPLSPPFHVKLWHPGKTSFEIWL